EMQDNSGGRDEDRAELVAAHERAAAAVKIASAQLARLRAAEHEASDRRAGLRARAAALGEAVRRGPDASAGLLAEASPFPGVLGPLAELITVVDGAAEAISAALGNSAAAIAVSDVGSAADILRLLREGENGTADLVIADASSGDPGNRQPSGRSGHATGGT